MCLICSRKTGDGDGSSNDKPQKRKQASDSDGTKSVSCYLYYGVYNADGMC